MNYEQEDMLTVPIEHLLLPVQRFQRLRALRCPGRLAEPPEHRRWRSGRVVRDVMARPPGIGEGSEYLRTAYAHCLCTLPIHCHPPLNSRAYHGGVAQSNARAVDEEQAGVQKRTIDSVSG